MKMIFDFDDYKDFIRFRLRGLPNSGRGQYQRIAQAAHMPSSNLSQVFNGEKHLTLEQADAIAEYLELSDSETDYFLLLILFARAGSASLRTRLQVKITGAQAEHRQLVHRLPTDRALTIVEKSVFYSNWFYSAVHILTFISEFRTVDAIASCLRLPRGTVQEIVNFLLQQGLCVHTSKGLAPGNQHTHLESTSPLVSRHHGNWRIKAMERHPLISKDRELSYSGQMALSRKDVKVVRDLCVKLIEDVRQTIDPSPSEVAFFLNLDWLELGT